MPDPLPWLEEFLDRKRGFIAASGREVIMDTDVFRAELNNLVRSALSRERAAAVEECARRAREMFLRTWAYAITIDEPSAEQADDAEHKLAELIRSALPLEAAATPTAGDCKHTWVYDTKSCPHSRTCSNCSAEAVRTVTGWWCSTVEGAEPLTPATPQIEKAVRVSDKPAAPLVGSVREANCSDGPLTPAEVREIAREEARRAAAEALRMAMAATEAYVGSLHKRIDELESPAQEAQRNGE